MNKVTITVTQQDIDKALDKRLNHENTYHSISHCPISQAVRRITGTKMKVATTSTNTTINRKSYRLPNIATNWLLRFDAGKTVKPFSFTISEWTDSQ